MLAALWVLLAVPSPPAEARAESRPGVVHTFDLTYTLRLDWSQEARRIWDDTHFVASLQGIVNRGGPRLYVYLVGGDTGRTDRFWMEWLRGEGRMLHDARLEEVATIEELVRLYRSRIRGAVVYDENVPATSNVASTVAGVEDLVCLRYDERPGSLYHRLVVSEAGPRLPVRVWLVNRDGSPLFTGRGTLPGSRTPSTGSAKNDAYLWAKERYLDTGRCNPRRLAYYLDAWWIRHPQGYVPNHSLSNHDYFISERGFFFDLSPWDDETPVDDRGQKVGTDVATLKAILGAAYARTRGREMIQVGGFVPWAWKYTNYHQAGGKREGVPSEWRYAEILSCFNAFMDADAIGLNAMANASVFRHYPLAARYPQRKPTLDDLRRKGYVDAEGRVAPRSYVAIYAGDYDAAAWLYQRLPEIWSDPARGTLPIGWAFNPNLADRFPPGMVHARRTATPNDYFIAGDSGAGYVNPSYLVEPRPYSGLPSGLEAWERHCARYYTQWDITLTGFVIDGFARAMGRAELDAYSRFSPAGIIGQKVPRVGMHGEMPLLRMEYDLYDAEVGAQIIAARTGSARPGFFMYRTILWTPSDMARLMRNARAHPDGMDIEVVDPYTLLLLVRQFHQGPQRGVAEEVGPLPVPREGSANLWHTRYGAKVLAHSPLAPGCAPEDLFGAVRGRLEGGGVVLFADRGQDGEAHFVEWQAAAPMLLERFQVYAHGDAGSDRREFGELRLFAREAATEPWRLVTRYVPEHPYKPANAAASLLLDLRLATPAPGSQFRLEVTQRASSDGMRWGPRILELVGVGHARTTSP